MFKIEYEAGDKIGWLRTEYWRPEEADQIARQLVAGSSGSIQRATVVEQAGYVYSEYVQ